MANEGGHQTTEEFEEAVNMMPKELESWLQTDESKSVGQNEGESEGHKSGRRIVKIQRKNKSDYTEDDLYHMQKVTSYSTATWGRDRVNRTSRTSNGATR